MNSILEILVYKSGILIIFVLCNVNMMEFLFLILLLDYYRCIEEKKIQDLYCLGSGSGLFETGFHCIALAGLKRTVQTGEWP